jgi:hypothetical protein
MLETGVHHWPWCCVLVDLMRQLKLMLSVMSIDLLPYRRMVIKENPLL